VRAVVGIVVEGLQEQLKLGYGVDKLSFVGAWKLQGVQQMGNQD